MTLPIQKIEESISVSYFSAIVANAGASADIVSLDFGVDIAVRKIGSLNNKKIDLGVSFDCQLKATINWDIRGNEIIYDLDSIAYNKIIYRNENSSTPCVLILMCLPHNKSHWLKTSERALTIKRCCYYHVLNGNSTKNKNKVRVRIPRTQLVTSPLIQELMQKAEVGTLLW